MIRAQVGRRAASYSDSYHGIFDQLELEGDQNPSLRLPNVENKTDPNRPEGEPDPKGMEISRKVLQYPAHTPHSAVLGTYGSSYDRPPSLCTFQ